MHRPCIWAASRFEIHLEAYFSKNGYCKHKKTLTRLARLVHRSLSPCPLNFTGRVFISIFNTGRGHHGMDALRL